jgi:hypothetical protein
MSKAKSVTPKAVAPKKSALAAFEAESTPAPNPLDRQKGKGETVGIVIRFTHDQWKRMHDLANSKGVSIQKLVIAGSSRLFEEIGLPPL